LEKMWRILLVSVLAGVQATPVPQFDIASLLGGLAGAPTAKAGSGTAGAGSLAGLLGAFAPAAAPTAGGGLGSLAGLLGGLGGTSSPASGLGALAGLFGGAPAAPASTGTASSSSNQSPLMSAITSLITGNPRPPSTGPPPTGLTGILISFVDLLIETGGGLDAANLWTWFTSIPGPDLRPVQALFEVPNLDIYVTSYLDMRNISTFPFIGALPFGPAPQECKKHELIIGMCSFLYMTREYFADRRRL
jgi:hypothetical protein